MRRSRLVPLCAATLVAVLAVASCGTGNSSAPRTITQTVTADNPTADAGPSPGTGVTVVGPNDVRTDQAPEGDDASTGSSDDTTTTPSAPTTSPDTSSDATGETEGASPETTSAPATSATEDAVDPLTSSCGALLDSRDIDKSLGATVDSGSSRIVDVANPDVHMTGRIKCYYGAKEGSDDLPVAVALSQYATADDAQEQMDVTVRSEKSLGAKASTVKVSGTQAHVLLRDGGFLILRHDTWTVSIAVQKGLASNAKVPAGLKKLAQMVVARVLKNG